METKVKGQYSINVSMGSGEEGEKRKREWMESAKKESRTLSDFIKVIVDQWIKGHR